MSNGVWSFVWLFEEGDYCAHLYPEDDDNERAVCGRFIEGHCDHCGHMLDIRPAKDRDEKCPTCLRATVDEEVK